MKGKRTSPKDVPKGRPNQTYEVQKRLDMDLPFSGTRIIIMLLIVSFFHKFIYTMHVLRFKDSPLTYRSLVLTDGKYRLPNESWSKVRVIEQPLLKPEN